MVPGEMTIDAAAALADSAPLAQILAAGVSADGSEMLDVTPLMTAAQHQRAANIRLLLEAGADPSRRDAQGRTAWWYASRRVVDFVVPFSHSTHGTLFLRRVVRTDSMRMLAGATRRCA
jgi:hypothetical protein